MVKRGSSTFSAASVTKGSVILSRAIEKNFALEAEISRLRHHVSVLSLRLHLVTLERDGLVDKVAPTMFVEEEWGETPLTDEEVAGEDEENEATPGVAESKCPSVAMVEESEDEAGEEAGNEAAPSVAGEGFGEKAAPSVAGEEVEEEAESVARAEVPSELVWLEEDPNGFDAWLRRKVAEMAMAEERRREENTAMEMVESAPEMAENCNRFKLDLVGEVDSVPDPLIPSCVDGLVRMRGAELEAEGGWPALSG